MCVVTLWLCLCIAHAEFRFVVRASHICSTKIKTSSPVQISCYALLWTLSKGFDFQFLPRKSVTLTCFLSASIQATFRSAVRLWYTCLIQLLGSLWCRQAAPLQWTATRNLSVVRSNCFFASVDNLYRHMVRLVSACYKSR